MTTIQTKETNGNVKNWHQHCLDQRSCKPWYSL